MKVRVNNPCDDSKTWTWFLILPVALVAIVFSCLLGVGLPAYVMTLTRDSKWGWSLEIKLVIGSLFLGTSQAFLSLWVAEIKTELTKNRKLAWFIGTMVATIAVFWLAMWQMNQQAPATRSVFNDWFGGLLPIAIAGAIPVGLFQGFLIQRSSIRALAWALTVIVSWGLIAKIFEVILLLD